MHQASKKIRTIIFAGLFLGGAVAVLVLVLYMVNTKGEALSEQMQLIADEQAFDKQHASLAAAVRETVDDRELLEGAVLKDKSDTIELLSLLDTVAIAQGVELTTKQLSEQEVSGPFNTLVLDYHIVGTETSVIRMLKILETLPYHGHVTSLSVRRSELNSTGLSEMIAEVSLSLSIRKHD